MQIGLCGKKREGVEKKVMNDSFNFHEHLINDEIALEDWSSGNKWQSSDYELYREKV